MWNWGLDTTGEARRFARLLERGDGLWKIGTVRIIWKWAELSKHVGGRKVHYSLMRCVFTPLLPTCELAIGKGISSERVDYLILMNSSG